MFFQRFISHVRDNPDKTAIRDSIRELTYQELWEEVCRKRCAAIHKGVTKEKKVLLMMNNSCEWVADVLALMTLGTKVVMISPDSKEAQVHYLCSKLNISYILTQENCKEIFSVEVKSKISAELELPDNQCEIVYHVTSGSTGDIKVCIRTLGQFEAEGEMYEDRLDMNAQDVIVCPLPLYHSYAFGAVFVAGLMTGATIVLLEVFNPRKYLQLLVSQKATRTVIVPAMAAILVNTKLKESVDLSGMSSILVGAGIVTEKVFVGFLEKFKIGLSSNYGSSETGGIITRTDVKHYPSIGKPMKGVSVQIRTGQDENTKSSKGGQMWVKAPSVMNRYFDNADIFDKDGYFFTGDLARMDPSGNIFITGREKNIVNIGGKKVNPVYVENILKSHPDIKDAVVIGKSRSLGGEYLAGIIAVDKELSRKDINQYLSGKLEKYMIPTVIEIVDYIPKNSMGKVNRESILSILKH